MKTTNTKNKNSLFSFVLAHLTTKKVYDGTTLPDIPDQTYAWGNDDAELFSPDLSEESLQVAEEINQLLQAWINIPSLDNKRRLYAKVRQTPIILIYKRMAELLHGQKLPFEILKLAEEWLYNASDREVLKFVYLLCGAIGLEQVRKLYSQKLYDDLFTLALCEEFTIFLCLACHFNKLRPQKKMWYIVRRTSGWGKAISLALLDFKTDKQQLWLLNHGLDLRIFWPPLAPLIITESNLAKRLKTKTCTLDFYRQCSRVIIQHLLFLVPYDGIPEYKFGSFRASNSQFTFNLEEILENFLRLAKKHATIPERVLSIMTVKDRLEDIILSESWNLLSPNVCNHLIGKCDLIIYAKNWHPVIKKELFRANGSLNSDVAELAAGINIDVWDEVFAYLQKHPLDPFALTFCFHAYPEGTHNPPNMPTITPARVRQLMKFIVLNERLFMNNEEALLYVLTFIQEHPGQGEGIIILALTSISDYPRGLAALALSRWTKKQITPAIRLALLEALHLNNNNFINVLLNSLLSEDHLDDFN